MQVVDEDCEFHGFVVLRCRSDELCELFGHLGAELLQWHCDLQLCEGFLAYVGKELNVAYVEVEFAWVVASFTDACCDKYGAAWCEVASVACPCVAEDDKVAAAVVVFYLDTTEGGAFTGEGFFGGGDDAPEFYFLALVGRDVCEV